MANFKEFLTKATTSTKKHSPVIFTLAGIGFGVATVIIACKKTPKYMLAIDDALNEKQAKSETPDQPVKLKNIERAKIFAKNYWLALTTGVIATGFIFGGQTINTKRIKALTIALNSTEKMLIDQSAEIIKKHGKKSADEVKKAVADKNLKDNPPPEELKAKIGNGKYVVRDAVTGTTFMASVDDIERAVCEVKQEMCTGVWVGINDFYAKLGVAPIRIGDILGWEIHDEVETDMIHVTYTSELNEDDEPIIVICYEPRYAYAD